MTLTTLELDSEIEPNAPTTAIDNEPLPLAPTHTWRWWTRVVLIHLLAIAIGLLAIDRGLKLRRWAFDASGDKADDLHFVTSLRNAIDWGRYTNTVGILKIYELLLARDGDNGDYRGPAPITLDYPPLRLLIAADWADWGNKYFPSPYHRPVEWHADYAFNRPMMLANDLAELFGAIAMFLLVRYWIRRSSRRPLDPCTGLASGLLAALLIWFNPAVIWDAHVFPQWDAWLLGPFLLAVYLALNNRWLVAGLLIGVAALAKGQVLIVLPLLLLWPLLRLRPLGPVKMIIGIALGVGSLTWPWLIQGPEAAHWVIGVIVAMALLLPLFFLRKRSLSQLIYLAIAIDIAEILCLWPFIAPDNWHRGWAYLSLQNWQGVEYAGLLFAGLAIGACLLSRRWIATWGAAGLAAAAFLCVPLHNGSMAWYTIGIVYPTRHWKELAWEGPTNLGALLQFRWNWGWDDVTNYANYIPFIGNPTLAPSRMIMVGVYVIAIALCALAIAIHIRRRDRRLLYALVAPWVIMFALLPQMLPRYLLWGAAFSACVAAISIDGFFLYLVLTVLSIANMAREQLSHLRMRGPMASPFAVHWLPLLNAAYPALGWAVLLLAGIWLCLALTPSRKTFQLDV